MKIIGLTGPARCGKDTVADMIGGAIAETGLYTYKRQGFADMLKLSTARIFVPDADLEEALDICNALKQEEGWVEMYLPGDDEEGIADNLLGISGRQFLQHYGTEAHRDVFGEDFWLDAVLPMGKSLERDRPLQCTRTDCDVLVIPDVRFENEAARVRECEGEVWQVVRPGIAAVEAHASESGIPTEYVSRTIDNSGTLDVLRERVNEALGLEVTA